MFNSIKNQNLRENLWKIIKNEEHSDIMQRNCFCIQIKWIYYQIVRTSYYVIKKTNIFDKFHYISLIQFQRGSNIFG